MSLPVLLAVDPRPDDLDAVTAPLARRYGSDYRIERAGDAERALALLADLRAEGGELALLLAARPLADAQEGGLFERAHQLFPHAKRGMTVAPGALADAPTMRAIVDAVAIGRIDYYVQLPAGPSDETFHHTVATFLLEWAAERRRVPNTVRIVGEEWTGRSFELRETFERCVVPHDFCLADSDAGRALLAGAGPDVRLPVMFMPDGSTLSDPTNAEIARAAGAPSGFEEQEFDVVVVGAGPAGLSAAVYGASEGLRTLVVDEGGIGGQARSSSLIRNYLGFPRGISGHRLALQAYEQASVFGASFVLMHRATSLARADDRLVLSLADERSVRTAVVILATGASYRRLGVPALEELTGAGVFYGGPAAEAHALAGADVFVAGGGNSAGQAVLYLARYARRVTLLVRGPSLDAGMSHYLVQEVEATPSIDVRTGTTVVGGGGSGHLRELVLRDGLTGEEETVAADALFVLIGARPHTAWLPAEIARDGHGFLCTGASVPARDWPLDRPPVSLETSMPGVLAAGDVRHASVKRVASAVGEGSIAVQLVHELLVDETSAVARR